jgi:hypothetical protein
MRPFRFFFGLAIAVILLFFLVRILFVAFIAAAVLSILYMIIKKIVTFISQEDYPSFNRGPANRSPFYHRKREFEVENDVEPLFHDSYNRSGESLRKIRLVETF